MVRYLPFLISLGLTVYALFSCIQTPNEDVPYLPKLVWIILIVLVPFAGPITWLLMSWSYRQRAGGQPRGTRPAGPLPSTGPPRVSAPDDDPEFLAWLDRQQRRRSVPKPPPKPASDQADDGSAGSPGADAPDESGEPPAEDR